jgi:hypothetical protein
VSDSVQVRRGQRFLRHLLANQLVDLPSLTVDGLRSWLGQQLPYWRGNAVFAQRSRIRDLHRGHPTFLEQERRLQRTLAVFSNSQFFALFQQIQKTLRGLVKAIEGVGAALERADAPKREALQVKLNQFQQEHQAQREHLAQLEQACPEYRDWKQAEAIFHQIRTEINLDEEEAHLEKLLRQQGHHSGQAGSRFEDVAREVTRQHLIPELLRRESQCTSADQLRLLTGVTLGAARTEIDQLLVRTPAQPGQAVEVLALVEVKRNVNDLVHGFRQRQENLAWLTGDRASYDAQMYRTASFPRGHFDQPAIHREGGEEFLIECNSFRQFCRDPKNAYFLNRLYLITRPGPLWNISSKAFTLVRHWVATDLRWNLDDDASLQQLLARVQSLAMPLETPALLRMYADQPRHGRSVLFVCG